MNELQLSNDIHIITAEIIGHKNMAGQSIFEIGRRLKYVKENNLTHGQWEKWCEETLNIKRHQANKYIKVFNEFSNGDPSHHLGVNALYLIATIPEEERKKEHITSSGEKKTVDEMTVKELQEVKAALKKAQEEKERAEKQAELARNSESIALKQLKEMEGPHAAARKKLLWHGCISALSKCSSHGSTNDDGSR